MAKRQGSTDRNQRKKGGRGGGWATSSQDFVDLIRRLYAHSKKDAADSTDGNWSRYVYAGLPMLMAALQAFAVEYERISYPSRMTKILDVNDQEFKARYGLDDALAQELDDLIELRNEIIHATHLPTGTKDNWPDYLRRVKAAGLLNSTIDSESDFVMLSQMASHRLFMWAVDVTRRLYERVVESDPERAPQFRPFLDSWNSDRFG